MTGMGKTVWLSDHTWRLSKMWYWKTLHTGLYIFNMLFHIFSAMEPQCCSQINQQQSTILLWINMNSTQCDITLYESGTVVLPDTPTISAPPWRHYSAIYISSSGMRLHLLSTEGIGGCHSSHHSKLWNFDVEQTRTNWLPWYLFYIKINHILHFRSELNFMKSEFQCLIRGLVLLLELLFLLFHW